MSPVLTDAPAATAVTGRRPSTARVRVGIGFRIARDLVTVAVWSVLAVAGGMALAAGLSLIGWAISGFGSANAGGVLRAGIDVYAVGQGLPLRLGMGVLTLTPLTVTAVSLVMVGTMVGRGRLQSDWVAAELGNVVVAALGYGVAATLGTRLLATPGAVQSAEWWRPTLLAALVLAVMLVRGSTTSFSIQARLPDWGLAGLKGAAVAAVTLLGGAALVLILGVLTATSRAGHVLSLAATGFGPGIGLTLTSAAFLPNAVVAAAGYVTGAGFGIGAASYSPLGSHLTTLPALPLLTTAPDDPGSTYVDLLVLVVPLAAGALAGWVLLRGIAARVDRLFGAAVVGVAGGVLLAVAAAVASGGVRGGSWADSGADPWRLALVAGVEFALVAGLVAMLGPDRSGPKPSLRQILRGLRRDREPRETDAAQLPKNTDQATVAAGPSAGRRADTGQPEAARDPVGDVPDITEPAGADTGPVEPELARTIQDTGDVADVVGEAEPESKVAVADVAVEAEPESKVAVGVAEAEPETNVAVGADEAGPVVTGVEADRAVEPSPAPGSAPATGAEATPEPVADPEPTAAADPVTDEADEPVGASHDPAQATDSVDDPLN